MERLFPIPGWHRLLLRMILVFFCSVIILILFSKQKYDRYLGCMFVFIKENLQISENVTHLLLGNKMHVQVLNYNVELLNLNSEGVCPVIFLNVVLNDVLELKPDSKAMPSIDNLFISSLTSNSFAFSTL